MLAGVEECGRESGFQLPPTGRVTLPDLGPLETRIGDDASFESDGRVHLGCTRQSAHTAHLLSSRLYIRRKT